MFRVFAQTDPNPPSGDTVTIDVGKPSGFNITNIAKLVSSVASALLIISAILAFVWLVLGGIQWITSGGDKSGMEAARNKITHAIVGLIVVAAAYAIMLLVSTFLGIPNFLQGTDKFIIPQPFDATAPAANPT